MYGARARNPCALPPHRTSLSLSYPAAKSIRPTDGPPFHPTPTQPPPRPESEPSRFPRDPNHLSLHGTQIIVATCPSIIRGLNHSSACEILAPAEPVAAPKGLISERGFALAPPHRPRRRGCEVASSASLSFSFSPSSSSCRMPPQKRKVARHKKKERGGKKRAFQTTNFQNLLFHPRRRGRGREDGTSPRAYTAEVWRRTINTGGENRHLPVRNVISNSKAMTTGRASAANHSLGPRTRLPAACAPPFLFLSLVLFALPSTPPSTSSTGQTRIVISAFDWWPFDGYRRGW